MRCLLFVLILAAGCSCNRLPPEASALVHRWLLKGCGLGDGDATAAELRRWGQRLEPAFIRAVEQGPPSDLVVLLQDQARLDFGERQQMLEPGSNAGLDERTRQEAAKTTLVQFIAREKESFDIGYRSRALQGLGIVGGVQGKQLLQRIAGDASSPLQSTARQALDQPARPADDRVR